MIIRGRSLQARGGGSAEGWEGGTFKFNTNPAKQGWDINISLVSGRGTFLLHINDLARRRRNFFLRVSARWDAHCVVSL